MESVKEYWVFLEEKEILAIFETLQECLCWKPAIRLLNPSILRVKHLPSGVFHKQNILVNPSLFL